MPGQWYLLATGQRLFCYFLQWTTKIINNFRLDAYTMSITLTRNRSADNLLLSLIEYSHHDENDNSKIAKRIRLLIIGCVLLLVVLGKNGSEKMSGSSFTAFTANAHRERMLRQNVGICVIHG